MIIKTVITGGYHSCQELLFVVVFFKGKLSLQKVEKHFLNSKFKVSMVTVPKKASLGQSF